MIASVHKERIFFALLGGLFILLISAAVFTEEYLLVAIPFVILFFYYSWQNKNVIFFLLLFALPFSFEYNFSPALGSDIPDEFLMILVSFLFFAYWVYSPEILPKKILKHPLLLLLILCLGWTMIAVLFSSQQAVSIKYLLAKSWYTGAFVLAPLVVFREKKLIVSGAITLAVSMLIIVIIALVRHLNNDFSFVSINDAVYPFFRNHVTYSAMLVCILPILFAIWKLSRNKMVKRGIVLAIVIALLALFFSYARGAWLALLAGMLTWWLIKKRLLLYSYIVIIVITACTLVWIKNNDRYLRYANDYKTTIFHSDFGEHFIATYKLKDVSTAERVYRWIAGIRMIKDNWLTGYGPNTFYDNYRGYTVPAFKTWVSNNKDHSTVHNYYLLVAIEQGLPGLLFFLFLLGALLYYAQYLYHRIPDGFYQTAAITTGMILVMIMVVNFLSDLIETDKIGSLFYLCIAILTIADINTRKLVLSIEN